ncbi:anti-sigma factor [Actinomycetospora soli]|uniref:anti-sigma factor n=1 Tax=Actinomycetospora soli TaxID=2893887 RepID=UPI001E4E8BA6|nr:anti-sigma factor [Actinomycetospora soli]MCD2188246.1 anti-sigma factor [Actinomycetospora soli]
MRATPDGHPELAVAWVLHTLEPEQDAEFAAHLDECAACLEIVAGTEEVGGLLGAAVEPVEPPPSLRARILEAAAAPDDSSASPLSPGAGDATSSTVVPLQRRRWVRRATAGLAVAAAAALVVVIGGLVNANRDLAQERDAAAAQADRSRQVVELVDAASRPGTPHAVLASTEGTFVGLVVDRGAGPEFLATGLPPNDAAHTYVLWGLAGGRPVGLGTFDMSGSGPVTASVPSGVAGGRFAGFAVSYEPGRTVPAAPTQVVASGQLAG